MENRPITEFGLRMMLQVRDSRSNEIDRSDFGKNCFRSNCLKKKTSRGLAAVARELIPFRNFEPARMTPN